MPHCHHNKIKTAKQGLQGHPWSDPCLPVQRHHSPLSHPSDHSGLVSVPVMCPACCCLWAFIFSVPSAWGALPQLLTWLALSYPSALPGLQPTKTHLRAQSCCQNHCNGAMSQEHATCSLDPCSLDPFLVSSWSWYLELYLVWKFCLHFLLSLVLFKKCMNVS